MVAVIAQALDIVLRRGGQHGAAGRGRGKERRGLGVDALVVGVFGLIPTIAGRQLAQLAFADDLQGFGEEGDDAYMAGFRSEGGGPCKQVIAGQHGGPAGPGGVQRGVAAADERVVNHVIVHQGGRVQGFDGRSQGDGLGRYRGKQARRQQRQGGAQALAAAGNERQEGFCQRREDALLIAAHLGLDSHQVIGHQGQRRQRPRGRR